MVIEKINQAIAIAIENSNLKKKDFQKLNGKYIYIILDNTSTTIYIEVLDNTFKLSESIDNQPDLTLQGSPIAFLNYINSSNVENSIQIFGNVALAEDFSGLMAKINIDWEQIIADYTSDDVAFYTSKFINFLKNKKNEIDNSFVRNTKEYFRDETDIIPSKEQINKHIEDVDNLRNKIEVLEAKFKKLNNK